jgi:hypothetical protein
MKRATGFEREINRLFIPKKKGSTRAHVQTPELSPRERSRRIAETRATAHEPGCAHVVSARERRSTRKADPCNCPCHGS